MPADFQPAPPTDPQAVAELELRNQARLESWWSMLGEESSYPVTTGKAVELLRRVEYQADHDTLLQYVDEKIVPPVSRDGRGRLEWHATDLVALACAMEARRKWIPFSTIHGHKLSLVEKIMQIHEHRGADAFTDLAQWDIDGLLGLLHTAAGDQGATQILTEAVRRKLQIMGVL